MLFTCYLHYSMLVYGLAGGRASTHAPPLALEGPAAIVGRLPGSRGAPAKGGGEVLWRLPQGAVVAGKGGMT